MNKVGADAYARLLEAMIPGDMTIAELAEETGLHYLTVCHYVRAMHKRRVAHIARRDPDALGRHNLKVFKLGPGKDAPPVRKTGSERAKESRARRKVLRFHQTMVGIQVRS